MSNLFMDSDGKVKARVTAELVGSDGSPLATDEEGNLLVKLTGSIVELGVISTEMVVTPGSSITVFTRARRSDFKSVRASIRWMAPAKFVVRLYHRIGDNGSTSGQTEIIAIESAISGLGEAVLYDEWYDVAVINQGASDATLRYCKVVGVR